MSRPSTVVRRTWWVVVLAAAPGGAIAFAATARSADGFTARALVVATEPTVPADQVATVLQSISRTDAVLGPTADELGVGSTADDLLELGRVSVEPGTSDLAVNVVATADDAELSAEVADRAATNLASVAEQNGFGTFAIFPSSGAGVSGSARFVSLVIAGAIIGAILAALALVTIAALRRRAAEPEDIAYADAVFRVTAVPEPGANGSADGRVVIEPSPVLESLRRALAAGDGGGVETVVVPTPATSWACAAVARRLGGRYADVDASTDGGGPTTASSSARPIALVAGDDAPLPRLLDARTSVGDGDGRVVVLVLVGTPR